MKRQKCISKCTSALCGGRESVRPRIGSPRIGSPANRFAHYRFARESVRPRRFAPDRFAHYRFARIGSPANRLARIGSPRIGSSTIGSPESVRLNLFAHYRFARLGSLELGVEPHRQVGYTIFYAKIQIIIISFSFQLCTMRLLRNTRIEDFACRDSQPIGGGGATVQLRPALCASADLHTEQTCLGHFRTRGR